MSGYFLRELLLRCYAEVIDDARRKGVLDFKRPSAKNFPGTVP